jgi:hypothetical protein
MVKESFSKDLKSLVKPSEQIEDRKVEVKEKTEINVELDK